MRDLISDNILTLGRLTQDETLRSSIDTVGDTDWFRVSLEAGKSYGFSVAGTERYVGESIPEFGPTLSGLFDAKGQNVSTAGNGTSNNELSPSGRLPAVFDFFTDAKYFEASTSGDYFISVVSTEPEEVGDYNLTFFEDDLPGDVSTPVMLVPGGTMRASIDGPSEEDTCAIKVSEGDTFEVRMEGLGFGDLTLDRPFLELSDAEGNLLKMPGSTSSSSLGDKFKGSDIVYEARESGTYYIAALALENNQGSYNITLNNVIKELGEAREDAFDLTVGEQVTARVDGGNEDLDWFSVSLEADVSYRFNINSDDRFDIGVGGFAGRIVDEAGETVAVPLRVNGSFENYEVFFTPSTSGIYALEAAHRLTGSGVYDVIVDVAIPVIGTDAADWLTLPDGSARDLFLIDGGEGRDTMSFVDLDTGVTVNLASGLARAQGADPFTLAMQSIENVTGTSFADTLIGSGVSETMRGLGGNDTFFGSDGADEIDGGAGRDTFSFAFSKDGVSASLLRGRGWVGDAEGDRIKNVENLNGTLQDDFLWGDHDYNRLDGSFGDDTLIGNGGDDYILGGFGTDTVVFSGVRAEYDIATTGFSTTVTHLRGGVDGTDLLGSAEVLRFADGDVLTADLLEM